MTRKNRKYLEDYKADLITAYFYQYTRQLPLSVLQEMHRIYEEETENVTNVNYHCSDCILSLVKKCARLYFSERPDDLPEDLKDKFIKI